MLPQRPGQCLMTVNSIFIAAQSSAGKKLWMDSLYLRDSRGQTNSSLADLAPDGAAAAESDSDSEIVVMVASGKKYDDSPASTARKLYLTNVTIQGNGEDGSRALYNTGKLFAQGARPERMTHKDGKSNSIQVLHPTNCDAWYRTDANF